MKIVSYNDSHYHNLLKFTLEAELDNMSNHKNIDKFVLDKNLFLVYIDNKIVATSSIEDFSHTYKDAFLVFKRTGTLKKYRGKYFPKNKTIIQGSGLLTYTLPYQIDEAFSQGAKKIFFTTNKTLGQLGSVKLDRYLKKIVNNDPRFSYVDELEFRGCIQTVWQIHVRDFLDLNSRFK